MHFPDGGDSALRDRLLAIVDDYQPTAIADEEPVWRIYFEASSLRDQAGRALDETLGPLGLCVDAREESDEDWARRSQEGLAPVHVGRFLIVGRRSADAAERTSDPGRPAWTPDVGHRTPDITILIEPSTGFGTGHHASTRLCLRLLQQIDVRGASVLDVGCGSGILAIAAARLGAARGVGLDIDPDAVDAARRNLELNPEAEQVTFLVCDITSTQPSISASPAPPRDPSAPPRELAPADVLFGNLTGTFLTRHADAIRRRLAPGGWCILSGILTEEEAEVRHAFAALSFVDAAHEDEWAGLLLRAV